MNSNNLTPDDNENDVNYEDLERAKNSKSGFKNFIINYRNYVYIVLAVIVAIALCAIFFLTNNSNNNFNKNRYASSANISQTSVSMAGDSAGNYDFLKQLGVKDYYLKSHDSLSKDERKEADRNALILAPENLTTQFLGKTVNKDLTDNESKAYNKDGSANTDYSYLTADNVSAQIMDDFERVINPVYGNWSDLQIESLKDKVNRSKIFGNFDDMFPLAQPSDKPSVKTESVVPLMYGDMFDNRRLNKHVIGALERRMKCDYNIQNNADTDYISCSAPVAYVVRKDKKDGGNFIIRRTLKISYVPNYSSNDVKTHRKLIITKIEQY